MPRWRQWRPSSPPSECARPTTSLHIDGVHSRPCLPHSFGMPPSSQRRLVDAETAFGLIALVDSAVCHVAPFLRKRNTCPPLSNLNRSVGGKLIACMRLAHCRREKGLSPLSLDFKGQAEPRLDSPLTAVLKRAAPTRRRKGNRQVTSSTSLE